MHILSIIRIIGILIMCFSGTMLIPAFVALIYGDGGGKAFMQAFALSLTVGILLWWPCHHHKQELRSRDGFLIVVAFWFVLGGLATLPLPWGSSYLRLQLFLYWVLAECSYTELKCLVQ